MDRIVFFIFILFFFNNCSFDNKSGIWTGSDKIVKKNDQKDNNIELVFKKRGEEIKEKNLLSGQKLIFDKPILFSTWTQSYQNKFNNIGNISFLNKGNFKKFSKISNSNINKKILVYKNNLFFSDYKGNIGIFSLKQNQIIFKFNFYKDKMKKTKKDINLFIEKNSIIAADNLGYVYSIDYKNNKVNWAKNFLIPLRSNIKMINQILFLTDEKNKIILIDIKNGNLIDELYTQPSKTVSEFKSNIAIDSKNNLLLLSTNGSLYSLNFINQKTINWIQNFKTESEIIFDGNPISVLKDKIMISTKKNISLLNQDGARLWDLNIQSNVEPILSGNTIITVTIDNFLVFINKDNGKIIYSKNINLLIDKDYKKNFQKKINKISNIYLINNKLLLISNNSYFIELDIDNEVKIKAIRKNSFKISSEIVFLEREMIFVAKSKRVYKVN